MKRHLQKALHNICTLGDTDIFPFPFENLVFYDKFEESVDLLENIHTNFNNFITEYPPTLEHRLSPISYTGFRWGAQIDPLWNAYFLALVLSVADQIELSRVPINKEIVFSYRYEASEAATHIFRRDIGWIEFQNRSQLLSESNAFVLKCDISDFYQSIYHHRLENALRRSTNNTEFSNRIMEILKRFSKNVSYGIPVGGPASRLLSELLLNQVDRLLLSNGIVFCRFADDYHLFTKTKEEAYSNLLKLSEILIENEGLSLQKSKTRIMTSEEFRATSHQLVNAESEEHLPAEKRFLNLSLHYDPYSETAENDYYELKAELEKHDVEGMLIREISKVRIHEKLTRRLVQAVQLFDGEVLNRTIVSMYENLEILYPVFSAIAILTDKVFTKLGHSTQNLILVKLKQLLRENSYILQVHSNLAYAVRLLKYDMEMDADEILNTKYRAIESDITKRDILLVMARRGGHFWISDRKLHFSRISHWERRALIVASYILGDEGNHWRQSARKEFTPFEIIIRDWAAEKKQNAAWCVPI